jgi:hypothetical protein
LSRRAFAHRHPFSMTIYRNGVITNAERIQYTQIGPCLQVPFIVRAWRSMGWMAKLTIELRSDALSFDRAEFREGV